MDFLKSAVASAIAKGPPFPYSFGDRVDLEPSIWTLYNGTRREDGSNCSIFSFDITTNKARLPLARNAVKKLRTLRHPGVIRVFDTVETETYIYIATERVVPLRWNLRRKSLSPETIKWGLFSVARTVKFINGDASSIHGSLRVASVFLSESGEWKLGGFEVLSNVKDDEAIIYNYGSLVPDAGRYTPPELARAGWDAIKRSNHAAVDAFDFGVLAYEAFNHGDYVGTDQAGQTKNIPPTMQAGYKRLVNANPKARITVSNFLDMGQRTGAFFDSPLIKLTAGIENLGVMAEADREQFLEDLGGLTDDFPEDFFKMKVLPELLKSVEFGGGGPKAFGLVMKIGAKLSDDDFEAKITPVVIRLFGNPDRAIRICLLDNLPLMIDRLSQRQVNDKIFPQIVGGFTDLAPVVREQTLKSVLTFVSKLSDRTINGELLRHLAKTANDEQPGIRTNTTICLGKLAKNLGSSSRAKVLLAAFTRSLRDPFVHARNASLMALAATAEYFSPDDCACRVLPAISPLLVDKEKMVRDQTNKTLDVFLQRVRKAAASMPDTVLPPPAAANSNGHSSANGNGIERMSTPQPGDQAGAAAGSSSWAGWAISSFTNTLSAAAGDIQSAATPAVGSDGSGGSGSVAGQTGASNLAPASSSRKPSSSQTLTSSASTLHRQAVKSPTPSGLNSRASSSSNMAGAAAFFSDGDDSANGFGDASWGDLDDGFGDDAGADAWDTPVDSDGDAFSKPAKKTASKATTATTATTNGSAHPFGADDDEPDFAGWLAAQAASKKGGAGKPLPKGLSKATASAGTGAGAAKRPALSTATSSSSVAKAKPVAVASKKKIDLTPKASDDTDAWGDDGW